ncbi:MAG: superoxide dismutase family protein [Clostridiaceae bacterium]|nr:superoxide dismutase family protein [Clostridiaceae bacterium]
MNNINNPTNIFHSIVKACPDAMASLHGSPQYPLIRGTLFIYQSANGVYLVTEVTGLPNATTACEQPIFAMHIHEGTSCSGNASDPFADAGMHYNPDSCQHPYHAGDLPPLFSNDGYAWNAVLTNRFIVQEVIGKTVIIHDSVDDFTSQPSGNSGAKIACGVIRKV